MNLIEFDNADNNINSKLNTESKKLFTKNITHRAYYYLLKKYDEVYDKYIHYILLSDIEINNDNYHPRKTFKTYRGYTVLSLIYIWNELNIPPEPNPIFVSLEKIESDDNGELYKLHIV